MLVFVLLFVLVLVLVLVLLFVLGSGGTGGNDDKILVLSCMDYRYIDATVAHLQELRGHVFDYFVLAGASLGYNLSGGWDKVFEEHIDLAIQLHSITEIVVVDHSDCGMYRAEYGDEYNVRPLELHQSNIMRFIAVLRDKYPQLKFEGLLLQETSSSPDFTVVWKSGK